ncbi:unnamed protein product [Symbiodinium pilosum]|uniref:Uncharacterized protein n=1 Tax=Symbiodinium pilosum TaxID=2952 RepID=A0A812WH99_SYMPI|nr:unnamed protein product [Symbiodinium pilosum]
MKDPPLTPLGIQDAKALLPHAKQLKPELLVVSPLQRATQTIMIAFRDAIDGKIPVVAHEGCRERLGVNLCDMRVNRSEYSEMFPKVDVSCLDEEAAWLNGIFA